LNTRLDFSLGRDRRKYADARIVCEDRTLVDGVVTTTAVDVLTVLFFGIGLLAFAALTYGGLSPAPFADLAYWTGVGGAIALAYTVLLKPLALGDAAIFIAYGPALTASVQCAVYGTADPLSALSLAIGCITVAVLHANNVRDIQADTAAGVRTVANLLGPRGSVAYFAAFLAAAHGVCWWTTVQHGDVRFAICSVTCLPWSLTLCRRIRSGHDLLDAPQSVGQHNTLMLCLLFLSVVPELLAGKLVLVSLFAMGGFNNLLSFSYVVRMLQVRLGAILGIDLPLWLASLLLAGAAIFQQVAAFALVFDAIPPKVAAWLLGGVFLLPVTLAVHDFWDVRAENDVLRKAVVQEVKGHTVVVGGADAGPRQLPTFTSDFDVDFIPFVKNMQVAAGLFFYAQYRASVDEA
jgi:1,4-dihydroxy-2-naphthoate octaprenyltransferase